MPLQRLNRKSQRQPPAEALEFHERSVRTHPSEPAQWQTQTPVVIENMDELAAYFVCFVDDVSEQARAIFAPYDDAFFAERFLVLIYFEEPSGSIFHRVDAVLEDGTIHISRHVPEVMTDDEGHWHVVIALCNSVAVREFNLIVDER